jgi:nitronate monooxygenase
MHSFFNDIGATLPLIQAPMAGAQDETLAIAVAQKGAVGSIPCARFKPDAVVESAKRFRAQTSGPLNLNFFCHEVVARDTEREKLWQKELNQYYVEQGVAKDYPTDIGLYSIDAATAEVIVDVRPNIVSCHFGLPAKPLLNRIRASGAKIVSTATTLKEALYLEAQGCDAIIAQGREAGGHQGIFLPDEGVPPLPMLELLTQCTAKLDIPVIAAGGIADPIIIRKAMQAGAAGTQIGTRFLKTPEATIPLRHRALLESHENRETEITNVFTGRPARGFVTRLVRETGPINANTQAFPLAISAVAPLKAAAQKTDDFTAMWAGKNWQTGETMPAADVIDELAAGFVIS